jgi:hypothetical protein
MNILIGTPASIPTPAAGSVNLFIDTTNNNILSYKDSSGNVFIYNANDTTSLEQSCTCDIAKQIVESVTCALNSGMITADQFGVIMGAGISVTTTKGTDDDGNTFVKTVVGTSNIPVISMTIDTPGLTAINLNCNPTLQLAATVLPSTASNKKVYWLSSNNAVATVDFNTGLVSAVAVGSVTITAYTADGGIQDTQALTVVNGVPC